MRHERTKIVATLGPATDEPGVLDQLVAAGMDCARLNCSHGDHDDLRRRARDVRQAAERAGRPLGLLFDLQGPKLRLGGDTPETPVEVGQQVVLAGAELPSEPERVRVEFAGFADLCSERSHVVIGDGVPRLQVEAIDGATVVARVLTPGTLLPRKGVNVTWARPTLPAITDKDIADLAVAAEEDADYVALSFVRSASDMAQLRERLREHGSRARTIAKVEKVEAYEHIDEIVAISDGIMVARGDYGVEAGVARVPLMQKDVIRRATQAGKVVITATQMLESMISSPEPTRAEAADVANAVIDGTSAVMLSAETSIGAHPVAAVRAMSEIAAAALESPVILGAAKARMPSNPDEAVLYAAVELADGLDADALVVPTTSGGAARACSKYRPRRPILALAHDPKVACQLALEWGVQPAMMNVAEGVDELIEHALECARDEGELPSGSRVVLTAGRLTGTPGATNLVMLREVP